MPGHILVVDDLPDPRATIAGLLQDAGHQVETAASQEEALRLLYTKRFHVAVLDARLDDSDENNQEGLELMRRIGELDPTIAVIILTGYATVPMIQKAFQRGETGRQAAFDFLEKPDMLKLPDKVRSALKNHVGLAEGILIEDPDEVLPQIAKRLRFIQAAKPAEAELLDELREVLAKLFPDCEKIQVRMIYQGFSGAGVLEVVPWHPIKGREENRIAKIGQITLIEKEHQNYQAYIQGMLGGHRAPLVIQVSRTRSLGAILYTYAGMGSVQNFKCFCETAQTDVVLATLDNLYLNTCAPLAQNSTRLIMNQDLRQMYMNHLHLDERKFGLISDRLIGKKRPFQRNDGKIELTSESQMSLPDPIAFALHADLRADAYIGVIHGDLYGNNILIDHHNETWLIDFERTGEGPILQDYVSLDNYVRLYLYEHEDLEMWLEWEGSFLSNSFIPSLENEAMEKIYHTVRKIRALAAQTPYFSYRNYLIGLLFNALRTATFFSLSSHICSHALLSACLIAEQISKEAQDV